MKSIVNRAIMSSVALSGYATMMADGSAAQVPQGIEDSNAFRLLPKGEIEQLISRFRAHVLEGDELAKTVLAQCAAHYKQHGDYTLMARAFENLPDGYINNGIRQWLYRNTPLRFDLAGKMFALKPGEKGYVALDVGKAIADVDNAIRQVQQGRPKRNLAARTFGLNNLINFYESVRGRYDRAKESGALVEADDENMLKVIEAMETSLKSATEGMKPAKQVTLRDSAMAENLAAAASAKPEIVNQRQEQRPN